MIVVEELSVERKGWAIIVVILVHAATDVPAAASVRCSRSCPILRVDFAFWTVCRSSASESSSHSDLLMQPRSASLPVV